MKNLFLFIMIFSVTVATTNAQVAPKQVVSPSKKLTASCTFVSKPNTAVEVTGYSASPAAEMSFAVVNIYKTDARTGRKLQKLAQYRLNYIDPGELSMTFIFENKQMQISLEIFGDNMTGRSLLNVGEKQYELACLID